MTDEQFETILAGAQIAHDEDLNRLGSLLNAVAAVGNDATPINVYDLVVWATKVAGDLVNHKNKNKNS